MLVFLVLATLVPLLAFVAIVLVVNTRLQEQAVEDRLIDTARALALAVERDLRTAEAALQVLVTSTLLDRGDWRAFYQRAAEIGQLHGGWIVLNDRNNKQIVNTARPYGAALPPGAELEIVDVVLATAEPMVTDLFVGAVLQRPVIAVVVPVIRQGQVRSLAFMGLLPERIAALFHAQQLDSSWSVVVFDRKGQVVAGVPGGGLVGRTPAPELVAAMRRERAGWLRSTTFENTSAYFAFARVPHADWTVALAIPTATAYADATRSLRLIVAAGLLALVLGPLVATVLGRRIARPLAMLAVAARASDAQAVPRDEDAPVAEVADVSRALRDAIEGRQREQVERQQRLVEETRRQVAEDALASAAASEERWRSLFEQAGEAVLIGDLAGICRDANAAACRLLGYRREELVGISLSRIVAVEEVTRLTEILTSLLSGETHVGEWTLVRKDGTAVPAEVNGHMADGRWQAFIRDITERRRAEQERARLLAIAQSAQAEAEAASHMKDEFLATLSHELRTPLSAILGWIRLLRSGGLDTGGTAHALDVIERNAQAQSILIRDLLDVSRIIRGNLTLDVRPHDLSSIVADACEALRPAAEANGVVLQCFIEPDVRGAFDAHRLQQVVWNLVTNALKFTPGGRVEVHLERAPDDRARLTVSDTGQGIPPEVLPRLFERFQQVDVRGAAGSLGLGIGLPLVKYLVEQHEGTVSADSAGPGKGATFTVTLPLRMAAPSSAAREVADRPEHGSLAGWRVLLVEDDFDTREMLHSLLTGRGADTDVASGAREALVKLTARRYDVIVTDIAMADVDGYDLLAQVRALPADAGAGTPVIALTAYASGQDERRALSAGFQRHLAKPVDPEVLVAAIGAVVRSASSVRGPLTSASGAGGTRR